MYESVYANRANAFFFTYFVGGKRGSFSSYFNKRRRAYLKTENFYYVFEIWYI